jgi:hypothetical protein
MFTRNVVQIIVTAIALTIICADAIAQRTVYKWVDEYGVVHFSDAPPDPSNSVETETVSIPMSPSAPVSAQPAAKPPVASAAKDDKQTKRPARETATVRQEPDITKMSIADLDRRCDAARERKIAPLREAEIAKCKQDKRNDPAWCERFNADFGDAGRTISGTMRPRMFDDLPACVQALQEGSRRRR